MPSLYLPKFGSPYEETWCCTYSPRAQASLDVVHPSAKSRAKVPIQLHFALAHPEVKASFGCEPGKLQVFCFPKMAEEEKNPWQLLGPLREWRVKLAYEQAGEVKASLAI